jgi:hypothetical protein
MLVGTPPRIPNELIGAEVMLPVRWARRRPRATTGPRALACALFEVMLSLESLALPPRGVLSGRR